LACKLSANSDEAKDAMTTTSSAEVKSPLSERAPEKVRDLPKSFILVELEKYYGRKPPIEAVECDYSLWHCRETGLEFAWPMRAGNALFYKWISEAVSYYPEERWEYGKVRELMAEQRSPIPGPFRVLDIGCGTGDFLKALPGAAENKFALDMNEPAITACRSLGFHAFCGTFETAQESGFVQAGKFSAATAFHCLEHVDDPVQFVRTAADVIEPGGRLYMSTPYSPMSFESDWYDVLNHPPHHMTRWNVKAYQRLAQLLGMKMRWFTPESTAARRTLQEFRILTYGPNRSIPKGRQLFDLLLRAPQAMRLFARQQRRGRAGEGIAADVILVEFSKG
jgi:2-polyprenyl-3-methyl-5-hydroxy-6-metoxy-1,4-benzoquinol methylase